MDILDYANVGIDYLCINCELCTGYNNLKIWLIEDNHSARCFGGCLHGPVKAYVASQMKIDSISREIGGKFLLSGVRDNGCPQAFTVSCPIYNSWIYFLKGAYGIFGKNEWIKFCHRENPNFPASLVWANL